MEGGKKQKDSSSIASDLFGTQELPPSSGSGFFASIFPHPSTKGGKNSSSSGSTIWPKQPSNNHAWQGKQATTDNVDRSADVGGNSPFNKNQSSIFQEPHAEPCHLSSSLYYGGQDVYSSSASTQNSESFSTYKNNGAEDDHDGNNSDSAHRGNWWQGSLYY